MTTPFRAMNGHTVRITHKWIQNMNTRKEIEISDHNMRFNGEICSYVNIWTLKYIQKVKYLNIKFQLHKSMFCLLVGTQRMMLFGEIISVRVCSHRDEVQNGICLLLFRRSVLLATSAVEKQIIRRYVPQRIMTFYSEDNREVVNTMCVPNAELTNFMTFSTHSNNCAEVNVYTCSSSPERYLHRHFQLSWTFSLSPQGNTESILK
jgi:hypothetical protein